MIKNLLDGVKEIIVELTQGVFNAGKELSSEVSEIFQDIRVKLMGSYEEIEAFEKSKEAKK